MRSQVQVQPSAFGIQLKLFVLLGFFALIMFLIVAYGLYGVSQISSASRAITEREIPLTRGIKEALVAMLEGKFALEAALAVEDFSNLEEIRKREAVLDDSTLAFDAYLAAIIWGSESEVFAKSDGGLNLAEWKRRNLIGELIIPRPSQEQVQLAGITDIYFGGFANNAVKAIASHKKFLRLDSEGLVEQAEQARQIAREHTAHALRLSGLAIESLSEIVKISNATISESARTIEQTQRQVARNILYIFVAGSVVSLSASYFLISGTIVKPLQTVIQVAQKISSGDLKARAQVESRDEIGVLAAVFNQMADNLAEYPLRLEAEVARQTQELSRTAERLQELLHENELSAKSLVQKNRELTLTNLGMVERNREFDEIGKMLVRRDLELTRTNERLQEMDQMKSEFVSVAAHQLRTPLTGIKWTLYSLLEESVGRLNQEQKMIASDAYTAAMRLVDLVNDLLDVARLEEGRYGFTFKKQALAPVVRNVFNKFKKVAAEKGVKLDLGMPKSRMPLLSIDEEKIAIVLDNLIDNAVKYTSPGGGASVRVAKKENHVTVEVRDTGIGIPEKQFGRVFTKFFRAENAQIFQTSGTGLGLYVAKNIIAEHKGTISFESKEGKGSIFSFSLPIPA